MSLYSFYVAAKVWRVAKNHKLYTVITNFLYLISRKNRSFVYGCSLFLILLKLLSSSFIILYFLKGIILSLL